MNANLTEAIENAINANPQTRTTTAVRTLFAAIQTLTAYPDDDAALLCAAACEAIQYDTTNKRRDAIKDALSK